MVFGRNFPVLPKYWTNERSDLTLKSPDANRFIVPWRILPRVINEKCRILHEAYSSVADRRGPKELNLVLVSLKMRAP